MSLSLQSCLPNYQDKENQQSSISKSAFSILGKRKLQDGALDHGSSAKKATWHRLACERQSTLTQMQLSVGQIVQKRCTVCGMSYVVSSLEDRRLHDKFHAQSTKGYDLGREFVAKSPINSVFSAGSDAICVVHCFDPAHRKRKAQAALEIVQKELGAVEIEASELWNAKSLTPDRFSRTDPIYRAYMYVKEGHCVGFLLVHEIQRAFVVQKPKLPVQRDKQNLDPTKVTTALAALQARRSAALEAKEACEQRSLELSKSQVPARLGVSRIWTASTCRQHGIAIRLLDTAMQHQLDLAETYGNQSARSREEVAFSQPTQAGARLARKWFGKTYGWLVYTD